MSFFKKLIKGVGKVGKGIVNVVTGGALNKPEIVIEVPSLAQPVQTQVTDPPNSILQNKNLLWLAGGLGVLILVLTLRR